MKKLFTFSLIFLGGLKASGQPLPIPLGYEDILNKAPYIFEGEVIGVLSYNGETGRTDDLDIVYLPNGKLDHSIIPLVAHRIKVTHVFRGNLIPETIELIVQEDYTHGFHKMAVGAKSIFFSKAMPSQWKPSPMQTDNEIRVVPIEIVGFYIENFYESGHNFKIIGRGFMAFGKIFGIKADFYQFLSQYPNITIPKEEEKK